jgi:gliding motility-associated-like protein
VSKIVLLIAFISILFNGYNQCPTLTIVGLTDVKCFGGNDGGATVQITPDGALPPCGTGYSISWSTGSNSPSISGRAAGVYFVNVTNNCTGCTSFAIAVIDEPYELTSTISKVDASCRNQTSGIVDLEVSGGNIPYSYAWNNGASGQDLINVIAGTYSVNISDNKGCTATNSIVVNQPASAISSSTLVTDVKCFLGNDGEVDLTVYGGTPPYIFSWNSGLYLSEDIAGLLQGSYSVVITDANGCIKNDNDIVQQPSAITSNIIGSDVLCFGTATGAADLTPGGGKSPYDYSWVSSNFTLGNIQDISNVNADKYFVEITDANNCIKTDSVTIGEPDALNATETHINITCNGFSNGSIDISPTLGGGLLPYSFSWSNSSGPIANTTEDLSNVPAETYTVVITDFNSCTFSMSVVLTEPSSPVGITHLKKNVSCYAGNDGEANISVTGGTTPYTYSWSHSPTTEDVINIFFGNYVVSVVDAKGCAETENVFINQPNAPLSIVDVITPVGCYDSTDGQINLTTSGGTTPYSYSWINSDYTLSLSTEDIINFPSDTYAVLITDSNNCLLRDTFFIPQPTELTISLSPTNILCNGESTGKIDLTVLGGTLSYSYAWSNGAIIEDVNSLFAGWYKVTVTDNNGCTKTDSVELTEPLAPLSSYYSVRNVTCHGGSDGSITYVVQGGTPLYSYSWSSGSSQKDIFNITAGTYVMTVTDANSCNLYDTIQVTEPGFVDVNAVITPVNCYGESTGEIDIIVTGGIPGYSYFWTNSDYVLSAYTQDLNEISTDYYSVVVTDTNGCKGNASFFVPEPDELKLNAIKKDITCFGAVDGEVNLNVTGGNPSYNYNWSNGTTADILSGLSPGKYTVIVTDTKNCNESEIFDIIQPDSIVANAVMQEVSCKDQSDGIIKVFPSGGNGGFTYLWSNGETTSQISGLNGGVYSVTITDILGCFGDAIIDVTVNPKKCIDIPNTITPNGDGINDTWIIDNLDIFNDANLKVFNEWGKLVFEGDGTSKWDGTHRGKALPTATYYYVITVLGGSEPYSGGITIIR